MKMSGQGPTTTHKVRRNTSPPQTRQRPIKAVQPFILKHSPSRSPSSPTCNQRRSPSSDIRLSPDRRSPSSPGFKVERPKPIRVSPLSSSLRRTSSLDTIAGPYLKGQWPVDYGGYHHTQTSGTFMSDKGTQTPDDWQIEVIEIKNEKKKKKHRRSASFGHADKKFGINSIRQKLQKTKDQGTKQRSSPIPANHNALLQTAPAVLMRSPAISIHIPKSSMPRYQRNSVEGHNPEIEKLVQVMSISGTEEEIDRVQTIDIPDGHRAPVPQLQNSTRSIDTQTPSSPGGGRRIESPASPNRPNSISPAIPIIPGLFENMQRPSSSYDSPLGSTPGVKSDKEVDSDSISPDMCLKKTASPKPNKIVREPPDGCEKVKFYDEDRNVPPSIKEPLLFCPIQGQGQFKLEPSLSSAFCPLKIYTQSHTQPSSAFTSTNTPTCTSIEGH